MRASDQPEVRERLLALMRDGLRPVTIWLALFYLAFAALDAATITPGLRAYVVAADLFAAASCLAIYVAVHRSRNDRDMPLLGTLLAGVAILTTAWITSIIPDPAQLAGMLLVVMGSGLLLLSWRHAIATWVLANVAWLVAAARWDWAPALLQVGGLTLTTTMVAAVVLQVRIRATVSEVRLRQDGAVHANELAGALREAAAAEATARRAEERMRRMFDAGFEGILIHDGERVLLGNGALQLLAGGRLEGQLVADLFADGAAPLQELTEVPVRLHLRTTVDEVPVEARARRIPWDEGSAVLVALRDLRPLDEAERARSVAREQQDEIRVLRAVNSFKTRFMNVASHELRTPLTPILLQIEVLRLRLKDDAEAQRSLNVLARNLERLHMLVRDILDATRLQEERLQLHREHVHVDRVVGDAAATFAPLAARAGIRMDLDVEPDLTVYADGDRLHQVVTNLLSNAVKFTSPGGWIRVTARASRDQVEFRVEDSGPGVPAADVAKLFQAFAQLPDGENKGGSGLGLFISRGIMEAQGGRIWCEPGPGGKFAFRVPVEAPGSEQQRAPRRRTGRGPRKGVPAGGGPRPRSSGGERLGATSA